MYVIQGCVSEAMPSRVRLPVVRAKSTEGVTTDGPARYFLPLDADWLYFYSTDPGWLLLRFTLQITTKHFHSAKTLLFVDVYVNNYTELTAIVYFRALQN